MPFPGLYPWGILTQQDTPRFDCTPGKRAVGRGIDFVQAGTEYRHGWGATFNIASMGHSVNTQGKP
jgi:hypothetical protein